MTLEKINFRSIGFELKTVPIDFFNGTGCPNVYLKPVTLDLDQVVIDAYLSSGIDYRFKENTIEVNPSGIGLLPGETDADILMAIDALPGVNTPDSKAGNLNIRGSSADQTLIIFDNIPIYHKGHYFGTFSPYNPSAVDQVKIYRSAYMADKGGRVGGAIEINSKRNIPDSVISGISLSTTYASAYTQVPLLKNKIGILLAGRSSYSPTWIPPKLKTINDFIYQESEVQRADKEPQVHLNTRNYSFYDFNGKLITKPGKKDDISLSLLGISNRVNIEIKDDTRNSLSYDKMNLDNLGYNIQWSRKWSDKIATTVNGTQSFYSQAYTSRIIALPDTVKEDAFFKNQLDDVNFKIVTDAIISDRSSLNFGYDFHYHTQEYKDFNFLGTSSSGNILQKTDAHLHSVFANYSFSNNVRYMLNAGVRLNQYAVTNDLNLEPRIIFNYFLSERWALKSSAGLYNQFVMQISGVAIESIGGIENLVWQLADGGQIPIVKSSQGMIGSIYHDNTMIVDIELYHKSVDHITINNITNSSSTNPYLYGMGKTSGVDFLIKKNWNNLDTWMSYSLSKSKMDFDSIQQESFLSIFDQTHVLDLVVSYARKPWKISSGWKYRSGLAALPSIRTKWLHGSAPSGQQQQPPPPPPSGDPKFLPGSVDLFTDRFPDYHQLDISVVYALSNRKKNWNSTIGLSFLNIYNRKNIIEQIPRPTPNGLLLINKYAMGFASNLVVTVNF